MIYLSGIFKKLHTILYYIISYIIRYNLGVRPLKSPLTPWAATSSLAMARLPWDTPAQGGRMAATDTKLDEMVVNNVASLN